MSAQAVDPQDGRSLRRALGPVAWAVLADLIDDAQYRTLLKEAERDLRHYVISDGTVSFAAPAHIATAMKG